jgi:hypothetical protein
MDSIQSNIQALIVEVNRCAKLCARSHQDITILAVSKTRTVGEIRQAVAAGCTAIGESYVQEALDKMQALADLPVVWHFIGPVQSNKTRHIAEHFDWVHSVDREKIARRLSDQRPASLPPLNVCIQVNVSAEPNKSGVTLEEVAALAETIASLPNLKLRGLMAIPQKTDPGDIDARRKPFRQLRECLEQLNRGSFRLDTLSMGMSGDFCAAIMEGATIVRPGTLIFGARPK